MVLDRKVGQLHPQLWQALRRAPLRVLQLGAGEGAKSLGTLARVLQAGQALPRSGSLVCIGGGTLGDLCTVAAHLLKRGVRLVQVPTTLLAAVDSSLGGKGALHLQVGPRELKNALGVFHYPAQTFLCPELFATLSPGQLREGMVEALKMAACLDQRLWLRWRDANPGLSELVQESRRLKAAVCLRDPYELRGSRRVLNFGHTFGHLLETLSAFRLSHGEAVGLGMLLALDVGRALGVSSERVALEVESGLPGPPNRKLAAKLLRTASRRELVRLLSFDKKQERAGALTLVLLARLGRAQVREVSEQTWTSLLPAWRRAERPAVIDPALE